MNKIEKNNKTKSFVFNPYSNDNIMWLDSKVAKLKYINKTEQAVKFLKEKEFAIFNPIKPSTACSLIIMTDKDDSIYQNGWHRLNWI